MRDVDTLLVVSDPTKRGYKNCNGHKESCKKAADAVKEIFEKIFGIK